MCRKLMLPLILILSVQFAFSQTAETVKKSELSPELKKEATAFLRETALDVNNLRSLENRISFSSEMASLMWFSDEKEARAMFQAVINDFRQLLSDYESQIVPANAAGAETEADISPFSGTRNNTQRKFAAALGVRKQIAGAIAEHDPQLALEFFNDTGAAITDPTFRKQIQSSDVYFEARLLNQIAEKNIETALKYGRQTLSRGFNPALIDLLKKIYAKDADKGAAFADEIVSKLKADASKPDGFYSLTRVLSVGLENLDAVKGKPDKRPMFSEQALRDIAELTAQEMLKRDAESGYEIYSYIGSIERLLPARAAQIRQKFDIKQKTGKFSGEASTVANRVPPPPISLGAQKSQENQQQLAENIKSLSATKLPADERKKVVEQSRKIIAETVGREQKMLALTTLALQVAKLGDKELASELMTDVRSMVNLQPKNYRDFLEVWMLSGAYSQVDPDKAFPILEDAVSRLNDTIGAFIKAAEFIDVSGEIIDDGEVQVGSFGGEMTRGLLSGLGVADTTIRTLAVADFARTKNLTGRFDRTEVRILAKMLVLRSIFKDETQPKPDAEEF